MENMDHLLKVSSKDLPTDLPEGTYMYKISTGDWDGNPPESATTDLYLEEGEQITINGVKFVYETVLGTPQVRRITESAKLPSAIDESVRYIMEQEDKLLLQKAQDAMIKGRNRNTTWIPIQQQLDKLVSDFQKAEYDPMGGWLPTTGRITDTPPAIINRSTHPSYPGELKKIQLGSGLGLRESTTGTVYINGTTGDVSINAGSITEVKVPTFRGSSPAAAMDEMAFFPAGTNLDEICGVGTFNSAFAALTNTASPVDTVIRGNLHCSDGSVLTGDGLTWRQLDVGSTTASVATGVANIFNTQFNN